MGSDDQSRAEVARPAIAVGQTIGGWLLEAVVGGGGGGQVFRARHLETGEVVALKLLHADLVDSPAALERFGREAAALARVRNPHVVAVRDSGVHAGRPYLAMAWLEGESLAGRLARGVLGLEELVAIVRGVAEGLDALHGEGMVHRDLKTANVMLSASTPPAVTLLDLGIALLLDGDEARLTVTGAAPGSLPSMAPEQLAGGPITAAVDVWALGVLIYEALAGRAPFGAADETAAASPASGGAPSLRGFIDVPPAVDAVLARCFAHDPSQRFPSAGAVAKALSAAAGPSPTVRRVEAGEAPALAIHLSGSFTPAVAADAASRCEAYGFSVVRAVAGVVLAVKLSGSPDVDRLAGRRLASELGGLIAGTVVRQREGMVKVLVIDGRRQIVGGDLLAFLSWPDTA